jgi:hypothetical protein
MTTGCATGSCGVGLTPDVERSLSDAVREIVAGGDLPPDDSPCCAYCAGIACDSTVPPESPAQLLERRRGCPISIVAYRAAKELQRGNSVEVEDRPGRCPILFVDGKRVDPLED